MSVRRATLKSPDDLDRIVEMGRHFVQAAWPFPYDRDDAAAFVRDVIERGVVFLNGHAMLGATIEPLYFNTSIRIACEHWWWSEAKGAGQPLLAAFEEWAAAEGADLVTVSTVHELESPAARIFERRGYRLRECSWVKGRD